MCKLKEIRILVIILLIFSKDVSAQSIGANYNEDIDTVDNEIIKKSQVKWVLLFKFGLNCRRDHLKFPRTREFTAI